MHLSLLSKRGAKEKEKRKERRRKEETKQEEEEEEERKGGERKKRKETCRAECLRWKTCLSVERQLFPRFVKSSRDRHTNGT